MRILILAPLVFALLGGPDPGPVPDSDDLGMGLRPTLQCGGRKRMDKWDAERETRLIERAEKAISGATHRLGAQLGAREYEGRREVWVAAQGRWEACLGGLRPVGATCAAAAARSPTLCAYAPWGAGVSRCHDLVDAARSLEGGGPPLDAEHGLTPEMCTQGDILASLVTSARQRCDGLLWREAIRSNDPGWCDRIGDSARRAACLAVYAVSPDLCPPPGPEEWGVLLDRGCRDATLDPGWEPETTGEWDGIRLRFSLLNMFMAIGRCVATVDVVGERGSRRVSTAWFTLGAAEAHETVAVTPVDIALRPASASDRIRVETSCSWALDDPGHGKEWGVMGFVAW